MHYTMKPSTGASPATSIPTRDCSSSPPPSTSPAGSAAAALAGTARTTLPRPALTTVSEIRTVRFDGLALWNAMDQRREERGLSWARVVAEVNGATDPEMFERNHPVARETLAKVREQGDCGCQHALGYLMWLDRTPESFLVGIDERRHEEALPKIGRDRRLRWDIPALGNAVDAHRRELGLTWPALAVEMGCSRSQVDLRRLRYGTGMSLAMRMTQWLRRSAASFTIAARW